MENLFRKSPTTIYISICIIAISITHLQYMIDFQEELLIKLNMLKEIFENKTKAFFKKA